MGPPLWVWNKTFHQDNRPTPQWRWRKIKAFEVWTVRTSSILSGLGSHWISSTLKLKEIYGRKTLWVKWISDIFHRAEIFLLWPSSWRELTELINLVAMRVNCSFLIKIMLTLVGHALQFLVKYKGIQFRINKLFSIFFLYY